MTAGEGRPPPGAHVLDERAHLFGRQAFVPVVIHHHDRRAVAGAEAFHFEQRERAAGVGLPRLDADRLAQFLGHTLGAAQRARQRAADVDHVLADRPGEEHRVVRDDVLDLGGCASNLLRDVGHRRRGEVSLLVLRKIERVENRRLPLVRRIPRHVGVELRLVLRRVRELAAGLGQLPFRLVESGRRVLHRRMKAHRSQSPITTSLDPITATTSAIRPPWTSFGSA